MIGIDPGPFTLGELLVMHLGRARHDWDQTANLLCQQANIHGRRRHRLRKFHPYYQRPPKDARAAAPISVLKELFIDGVMPGMCAEPDSEAEE